MGYYLNKITVNKLFHLNNFEIPITDEAYPHLIITGKNGSGKTVLLNAVADFLEQIKQDTNLYFMQYRAWEESARKRLEQAQTPNDKAKATLDLEQNTDRVNNLFGKVELGFNDVASIILKYQSGDFILAFYQADRKVKMDEPQNPTKPQIPKLSGVKETATAQFLNFLSDLKIQEALARNENQNDYADSIRQWFISFEQLLQQIYQDDRLHLEFIIRDYSFRIVTGEKSFKLTEMSDGFAAVIDIVADLILKMQGKNKLTRAYQKQGIVLIDEIETHLHLSLQKLVLPMLSRLFPNIQFIVTTHSPFVLSSMNNAIAYDLEHRQPIEDLTEYSFEALTEGYFGVKTESSYIDMRLKQLEELLASDELSDVELVELKHLIEDFNKIPEAASPMVVGRYRQLRIANMTKLKQLGI